MQLPIRSCLFFPFGQASPVPLCRHYPCFPLRESLPNCRFKAISASRVAQGLLLSPSGRLRLFRCTGITLAFPFFAFSLGGEKREKTYVSGESLLRCHQASATSRVRKASCFPLRGEWRKAPREVSLNSPLFFKPCPCSFFLRKNSQNCQPLRAFPLPHRACAQ